MIPFLLALVCAGAPALPGQVLSPRFQGEFALLQSAGKEPRLALAFRELSTARGRLLIYSLETGGYFADYEAAVDRIDYGRNLGAIHDLDGDGFEDLALCCRKDIKPHQPQHVELHSGRDGALLGDLDPEIEETLFGEPIAALPDVDGDGKPDFLIGAGMLHPERRGSFAAYGVYSGATRERIGRVVSEQPAGNMQGALVVLPGPEKRVWAAHAQGRAALRLDLTARVVDATYQEESWPGSTAITGLASVGDLDGDGLEEVALALNSGGKGQWQVLDGKRWKPREPARDLPVLDGALAWLSRGPDLDGDGVRDLFGSRNCSREQSLSAFSGRSLACLRSVALASSAAPFFGGQCGSVQRTSGALQVLVASIASQGRAAERGVLLVDWQKGEFVRAFGRP